MGFAAAVCVAAAACGKKGPPLAPLVRIPAAVDAIEATRVGSDVYVTLTIPSRNLDDFMPADVSRVEVYGYTGRNAPPRSRWVELGTLVAVVPVAPPPSPDAETDANPSPEARADAPLQGASVTVRDTLTADELMQGKLPDLAPTLRDVEPRTANPARATENGASENGASGTATTLRRYYTAFPFSPRGRPAPPGEVAELPLLPIPEAPPAVYTSYTEKHIEVTWEPSGGLLGFLLERALPDEPPPADLEDDVEPVIERPAEGPLSYNVYRELTPDLLAPPDSDEPAWRASPPLPVNMRPLAAFRFEDTTEFGRERCYTVRAVRGAGPDARVGDSSPPACLTPIDVFPPGAPQSLAAVASEGAISLVWEPNTELDLGGYVVLRGESPGDTLQPLTPAPLLVARYRDEDVTPGTEYVYAVVAVDNRFPIPNASPESNRVQETAR